MSNNNANTGNTSNTSNTNNYNNPAEEAGPPTGFVSFRIPTTHPLNESAMALFLIGEIADAMNTQPVPEFESFDFDEPHSDHGSASSKSDTDTDTPAELLCTICSRRREWIRYIVCGHHACASCTKKLWWSRINRPDRARDPWPTSIPCPFCRAEVTAVVDGREDAVGDVYSAVSVPGAPVVSGGATGAVAGDGGAGGGRGMLIVDWMLMRSKDALRRLQLETTERVAAASGDGDADNGERGWHDVGDLDWNEFFFE
ncbi:hypothetical protein P167DRAFT_579272 [Morchella conica CCBAS932]|uniref:RING-type domain-containing protein n=1 Tax=Morchella conica CCBAS932 TaxID=1392247 RepID=A0A3N4K9T9_9PEZI|nr:hypothetical protein P167DRAFT_609592 [Morchella conica CCBAS932]RPB07385.1 hypothetical protein P167DRAFT_579272 [Morchella conica CCBAS932]